MESPLGALQQRRQQRLAKSERKPSLTEQRRPSGPPESSSNRRSSQNFATSPLSSRPATLDDCADEQSASEQEPVDESTDSLMALNTAYNMRIGPDLVAEPDMSDLIRRNNLVSTNAASTQATPTGSLRSILKSKVALPDASPLRAPPPHPHIRQLFDVGVHAGPEQVRSRQVTFSSSTEGLAGISDDSFDELDGRLEDHQQESSPDKRNMGYERHVLISPATSPIKTGITGSPCSPLPALPEQMGFLTASSVSLVSLTEDNSQLLDTTEPVLRAWDETVSDLGASDIVSSQPFHEQMKKTPCAIRRDSGDFSTPASVYTTPSSQLGMSAVNARSPFVCTSPFSNLKTRLFDHRTYQRELHSGILEAQQRELAAKDVLIDRLRGDAAEARQALNALATTPANQKDSQPLSQQLDRLLLHVIDSADRSDETDATNDALRWELANRESDLRDQAIRNQLLSYNGVDLHDRLSRHEQQASVHVQLISDLEALNAEQECMIRDLQIRQSTPEAAPTSSVEKQLDEARQDLVKATEEIAILKQNENAHQATQLVKDQQIYTLEATQTSLLHDMEQAQQIHAHLVVAHSEVMRELAAATQALMQQSTDQQATMTKISDLEIALTQSQAAFAKSDAMLSQLQDEQKLQRNEAEQIRAGHREEALISQAALRDAEIVNSELREQHRQLLARHEGTQTELNNRLGDEEATAALATKYEVLQRAQISAARDYQEREAIWQERLAGLQAEVEQHTRSIRQMRVQSAEHDMQITKLAKSKAKLKDEVAYLNIALEAKQMDVEQRKRQDKVRQLQMQDAFQQAGLVLPARLIDTSTHRRALTLGASTSVSEDTWTAMSISQTGGIFSSPTSAIAKRRVATRRPAATPARKEEHLRAVSNTAPSKVIKELPRRRGDVSGQRRAEPLSPLNV
ncbi:hypothetical protein E5Q_00376 [Mixia osmundae IAM 14324]|uniref:Uncharacterized protein n=1 Tax=Mixia osmundae (strain CBS 9802 / IAM 14324 / JCM 22182 / KY 12970) TaxID=764103 RepID=G7DT83_MIXOS|nr:hypothetical protein E5Q_00376 [Mixia osmundae IAM 14324]